MARERRLHVEQTRGFRFVVGWGLKRSATVVPAPLRYWQYRPAGPTAIAFVVLVVGLWLGAFAWVGGWPEVRGELPLALIAGLSVLVLSTGRFTVSAHGMSFDVAATRTEPARVVPLLLVREVRVGRPPEGWPKPRRRGGWWPGRTRVAVRHLADDEAGGEQAFTLWVRDPEDVAAALGVPLER
ncbi:hypothetical protein SAMN05216574_103270 [Blastococcus tunisiensis]|uniref:PH domain-containing protein n=1 Tax=Blastococcus tunisiensis TaxID=1798228 RepID=A0A1I2AE24_9ACTN|nr:hypothetical protein SAMN05216574_103270 [Blastococcus sp. DSM 46838]